METNLKIDVTALDDPHRRVLEEVLGQPLTANQRVIIRVTDVEKRRRVPSSARADAGGLDECL